MRYLMLTLSAALFLAPVPATVQAADSEPRFKTERVPAMRERAYKQLARARDLAEEARHVEALEILGKLRDDRRSNAYEKAMAWNLSAYVSYELDRPADAIEAYRQVLAQETIPSALGVNTLYQLGQMHMTTNQYAEAARALEQWFELAENPGASAYILLGSAYYQLQDYARARQPIETALAESRAKGEKPAENALLLLRAIYFADENFAEMAGVLKELCQHYPGREYWVQLAAVYGRLGQSEQQLAAMVYAHDVGYLETQSDFVTLAQLLLGAEVPYKAAEVLSGAMDKGVVERNIRHQRMLADAWLLSKELDQAIDAMAEAARQSADGDLSLRLAELLFEAGRYGESIDASRAALGKGGLSAPEKAHLVAGLALYELDRFSDARQSFREAAAFDGTRQVASQWMAFIEKEIRRVSVIREMRQAGSGQRASAS